MAVKSNKKKEMLLKSFDVIKDDFKGNKELIADAVSQMFSYDEETAKDMWLYLLDKYNEELKGKDCGYLSEDIAHEIKTIKGDGALDEIILGNPKIKNAMFSHRGDKNSYDNGFFCAFWIIRNRMRNNDFSTANELIDLVYHNKHRNCSWFQIMHGLIDQTYFKYSEESYDLLNQWLSKVETEKEKAKLSIMLLKRCV